MSFNHTLSAVLRGRWLIEKKFADSQLPMVMQMLRGESVGFIKGTKLSTEDDEEENDRRSPELIILGKRCASSHVYSVRPHTDLSMLPDRAIALVTLAGPLLKRGGLCSYGMIDYANLINRLGDAPHVAGILLNIDSPGGQADGTAMLADVIKNVDASKPVLSIVDDGMAASAAAWIASATREIYLTQPTDQFGSVGVYTSIPDWNTHYKEHFHLPVHDIYAPQSSEKNKDYKEAIAGNYEAVQEELKVLADQFINTVASNREGKIKGDDWKTGKMFYAKDAKRIGLIDGIKSFSEVVQRMETLTASNTRSQKSKNKMAFEKTLAAANAESFAVVEGGFLLTEEHLTAVENHIASLSADNKTNAELVNANNDATAKIATLEAAAQTSAARIAELEAEVASLGKQSSGEGTALDIEKDKSAESKPVPSYADPNSPINQLADKRLRRQNKN